MLYILALNLRNLMMINILALNFRNLMMIYFLTFNFPNLMMIYFLTPFDYAVFSQMLIITQILLYFLIPNFNELLIHIKIRNKFFMLKICN